MKKFMNPKEWIGTGIQLIIFAALLPFLCILLGLMMESAPAAKNEYAAAVISFIPGSDPIQNVVAGLDVAHPGASIWTYFDTLCDIVSGNIIAFTYLGLWLFAFRTIFKEMLGDVLRLRGIPILQVVCGLFFGAMTFMLLQDQAMQIIVTAFLVILNIVLTIVCFGKAWWKKLLDLLGNLALQSYLAALTIGYIAALSACVQGLYPTVSHAITAMVIVTLLWLIYMITQYFITEK